MLLLRPNDPRHFLDLRPGKNARNKWHSDVGRARSDARPAAKMGRAVEILPEKYSSITAEKYCSEATLKYFRKEGSGAGRVGAADTDLMPGLRGCGRM